MVLFVCYEETVSVARAFLHWILQAWKDKSSSSSSASKYVRFAGSTAWDPWTPGAGSLHSGCKPFSTQAHLCPAIQSGWNGICTGAQGLTAEKPEPAAEPGLLGTGEAQQHHSAPFLVWKSSSVQTEIPASATPTINLETESCSKLIHSQKAF